MQFSFNQPVTEGCLYEFNKNVMGKGKTKQE